MYKIRFNIADTIIQMESRYRAVIDDIRHPLEKIGKGKNFSPRYRGFIYRQKRKAEILIRVDLVDKMPHIRGKENVFVTLHFLDKTENWRLMKRGGEFIYWSPLEGRQLLARIDKDFKRFLVYLRPLKMKETIKLYSKKIVLEWPREKMWDLSNVIYDFLQVVLIQYLTGREGVFIHGMGVRDREKGALVFAAKSGGGKTTLAKLWHTHRQGSVYNDDRIIIRYKEGSFFIYSNPWHGDFSDYLASCVKAEELKRIFFIYHSSKNTMKHLSANEAFQLLYPCLILPFWDRGRLTDVIDLCERMVNTIPCFHMGFRKDNSVIQFVRNTCDTA